LALARLATGGVQFRHGDLRQPADLFDVGAVDLILDCAAEPSVRSGYGEGLRYLYDTNLTGTLNTLELARQHGADFVFLSTSRIYPMGGLRALPLTEGESRLDVAAGEKGAGWSAAGIAEDFPLPGARSFYGATKLASELLIAEYTQGFGLRALVNRCGVIAGPWQMGKVDQGFFVLWVARHFFRGPLGYQGYGGRGVQVRDVLAADDLAQLLWAQLNRMEELSGQTFNVGGGRANSVSLRELTGLCETRTGVSLALASQPTTHPADVPWYIADNAAVTAATTWSPRTTVPQLLDHVLAWLEDNGERLRPLLGT
jgi:CDP-paratose 2-epimerase